jgi:hypothetical protein
MTARISTEISDYGARLSVGKDPDRQWSTHFVAILYRVSGKPLTGRGDSPLLALDDLDTLLATES